MNKSHDCRTQISLIFVKKIVKKKSDALVGRVNILTDKNFHRHNFHLQNFFYSAILYFCIKNLNLEFKIFET
jgi:hypothetical protein